MISPACLSACGVIIIIIIIVIVIVIIIIIIIIIIVSGMVDGEVMSDQLVDCF